MESTINKGVKERTKFFMECHLAGRMYHEATEVWDQLRIGTEVKLVREPDNRYDPNAIQVVFVENCLEGQIEHVLGYIPATDNSDLAILFDMGWEDIFECRISKISPEQHYENQIRLTIKIRRKIKKF